MKILLSLLVIAACAGVWKYYSCHGWDKTFPKSDKVDVKKVSFVNRYGIELVGDLYTPKNMGKETLPAIAVSGPFGAVKEQSSGFCFLFQFWALTSFCQPLAAWFILSLYLF